MRTATDSRKTKNAFLEARRAAETVLAELNRELELTPPKKLLPWMHPSRSGEMTFGDRYAGSVFELHPAVVENFGLECAVAVMALNLDELASLPEAAKKYAPVPEFPAVERDLAISVKKSAAHADILAALLGANPLLKSVQLFDVYEGEGVGADSKSMAYHFVYQGPERTLVTEEVDKAHEGLVNILKEKFGAEVR